jgi:hypothetical protein
MPPTSRRRHARQPLRKNQGGYALIVLLAIVTMGILYSIVSALTPMQAKYQQSATTQDALRQAKEALIAYAVSVNLSSGAARLGDLPCPDLHDQSTSSAGKKGTSCGNAAGTTGQSNRLGLLPWKDLGLPELRDGSGEHLWYAVSSNFKENTRVSKRNSDTPGTISIKANDGTVYDSTVIAVIIAPGAPITRADGYVQSRSTTGIPNPKDYLDIDTASGEDNAAFQDNGSDGFISGPIRDGTGTLVTNDQVITITYNDLMPLLQKRVAQEVLNCLSGYTADPNDGGRYPWMASLADSAALGSSAFYNDSANTRFGRFPSDLSNTIASNPNMLSTWGSVANCNMSGSNSWFKTDWSELVFIAIASAFTPSSATAGPCAAGSCLTVGSKTGIKTVVLVSGKTLPGQSRGTSAAMLNIGNYLEGDNATPLDDVFSTGVSTATYNDYVLFQ